MASVQSIMASTLVLLLQLLLVSLGSASHNYGGIINYNYKGRTPDGGFLVSRSLWLQTPAQTWSFTLQLLSVLPLFAVVLQA